MLPRRFYRAVFLVGCCASFSALTSAAVTDDAKPEEVTTDGGGGAVPSVGQVIGADSGSGMTGDPYTVTTTGSLPAATTPTTVTVTGQSTAIGISGLASSLPAGSIKSSIGSRGIGYVGSRVGAGRGANSIAKPPAENNSDTQNPANPASCNPVVLSSGEKYKDEVDFSSMSEYGLSLARTYRSKNATGLVFGANWMSSLDPPSLTKSTAPCIPFENGCFAPSATVTFSDGAKYSYTLDDDSGSYSVKGAQATGSLHYNSFSRLWGLTRDNRSYSFYDAGGPAYKVGGRGGETLLTYLTNVTGSGYQISKITNLVGQTVEFTWISGRMTKAKDPDGKFWNYAYNSDGMLQTVTAPGTSPDIRTYHYEDPADPKLLTGISINNIRYSTYAYYSDKRVKSSSLSTGEENDNFTYGIGTTKIIDARGESTTYTFEGQSTELKPPHPLYAYEG
jgi:YD repeat-containing protein